MKRSLISLTQTGAFANTVLVNAAGTSVQLRQTVTSDGLTVTTGNGYNDSFMDMPTRHLEGYSATRTVLLPVPAGTTAEQALAKVAALPAEACLYYRTSDDVRDLLGANQLRGIESGRNTKTLAQYEQELRMPLSVAADGTVTYADGIYRATFFSLTAKADVDLRIRAKVAVPAAAPAELAQAPAAVPAAAEVAPF